MVLLDFIELSDDEEIVVSKQNDEGIVNLSSHDETAEESHNDFTYGNPCQQPTTLHDGQAVFVAEGEGREEAAESGNADEATPSSSVMEKGSLGTTASQNCPHTPTAVSFTCNDNPGQQPTTLHDGQAVFVAEGEGRGEASESGNTDEATPSSSVMEKGSLGTAASQNCPHTPMAVSLPCPTSISAKALTFEACDANLLRVKAKRHRKLFHTDTPWRSPRLEGKNKGRRKSAEELAVDLKRSRMLEEQSTSAASQNGSHTPAAVTFPSPTSISAKALTIEACDANFLRVEVKRSRKLVQTARWRSPRLEDKNKGRRKSAEELAVDLKRSRMLEEQHTSARSQKNKSSLCTQCRMCKDHLY